MDKDFSDMMNKFSDMMGNLSSGASANNNSNNHFENNISQNNKQLNFDINTLVKLKSVMDNMNSNPDPRSNLLKSLKPYLRETRQAKIDQYINLFSMSKIVEAFKQSSGGEK